MMESPMSATRCTPIAANTPGTDQDDEDGSDTDIEATPRLLALL
jgi:hypothetical protein